MAFIFSKLKNRSVTVKRTLSPGCLEKVKVEFLSIFALTLIVYSASLFLNVYVGKAEIQHKQFKKIENIIRNLTRKGAEIGCRVVHSKSGQVLWNYHPEDPLIPASNMKLLTTSVSLIRLGPDYRFKTGIYTTSPLVDGILHGDLYLKGFGDPFLVNEQMWMLTHELALRGLKKITGDIIADESFFDHIRSPEGWDEDRPPFWYNAEIGALSFNFNTVTINIRPGPAPGQNAIALLDPDLPCLKLINDAITINKGKKKDLYVRRLYSEGENVIQVQGRIPLGRPIIKIYRTIKDPATYTIMAFRSFLKSEGIEFDGKSRSGRTPENAIPFYIHESKPLSRIIADLNKISNNFIAEQILKTMGAEIEGPPGTHAKGLLVVKETLVEKGIPISGLKMYDGSGLSPLNRIPVRLICDILLYTTNSDQWGPEFVSSLAVSGIDGTLKDRQGCSKIAGKIRAKTGRISGVSALSGYLWTISGKPLIFSILMNGKKSQMEEFMNSQDRILSILYTIKEL